MAKAAYSIMFVRHGESEFNKQGLFCGWYNAELSPVGLKTATESGQYLKKKGYTFDLAFVSLLTRSIDTLNIILKETNYDFIPVTKDWRLNERHYGDLQGRKKEMILEKFGPEKFMEWRRGYNVRPPKIVTSNPTYKYVQRDVRYHGIKLPETECLADVVKRVEVFWKKTLVPEIKKGKKIIVAAHGNSIRAVVKLLENTSKEEIVNLNIALGIPLVFEFDKNMNFVKKYYVGDPKKIKAMEALAKGMGRKK